MADAGAARQHLPDELRSRYTAEPFLTDRMADALVAADLVVGRAGSSTCAELTAVGVASILVPYPYAGAHQRYNASYLGDEGAARVVADEDLDADRLVAEVTALRDDERRAAMADAARRLGRPDAARALADELAGDGRAATAAIGDRGMSATVADALERLDAMAVERGVELRADVPLAPLTTLRVGGPADRMAAPETLDDLVATLDLAREAGVPAFLLGKGSDLVVADAGHPRARRARPRRCGDDRRHHARGGCGRLDDGARQALRGGRPGRLRLGDQHPRHRRRRGVGERGSARRRDGPRRSRGRGARSRRRAPAHRPRGVRLRLPRLALQARRGGRPSREDRPASRATPMPSAPSSTATRRTGARPSRWPTRTRGASSAIRQVTTPGGSSRRPG